MFGLLNYDLFKLTNNEMDLYPEWFKAEKYYNCDSFFNMFFKKN